MMTGRFSVTVKDAPDGIVLPAPSDARLGGVDGQTRLEVELPALAEVMASVATELGETGTCLLRGLPEVTDAVLVLMASAIGELVPAAASRPRRYVEDIVPVDEVALAERPHSQRRTALPPHTDQSARETPPDFLALACVANEPDRGGESVLVPAGPVVEQLRATVPDVVELLQDPVFPLFNVPKRDFAITAPLVWVEGEALTGESGGTVRTRFRDEAVRAGLVELRRPSDAHVAAFESLAAAYHDETWWVELCLEPGDALFFDNTRVLHGRREVSGGHRRHLKRVSGRYRNLEGSFAAASGDGRS